MAAAIGSWRFLMIQAAILAAWVTLNTVHLVAHWDSSPYVLLNSILSVQAAFTGPILLIVAKFASRHDRVVADKLNLIVGHIERIGAADHVEHGKMLEEIRNLVRDTHSHVSCEGHTTIGGTPKEG